ncbi:MAG: polysaccharide pyruvyl transferase family protein [Clostridia bacterium]|nr:polysaccharide pyruvyl transferase family protein [Clostridia bacterium]
MKKIGIATFYTAINYGVHLQAYALKEAIEQGGYGAQIVNYPHHLQKEAKENSKIKKYLGKITNVMTPHGIKRYFFMKNFRRSEAENAKKKSFKKFSAENFNLTEYCDKYSDVENICGSFDAFVCGSDQIWNPHYTACNPFFFLRFAPEKGRIAYAPSIGVSEIPKEYEENYKKYLGEFASLSSRESSACDTVQKLTGRECKTVVDPTLLHSGDFWDKLSEKCDIEGDYALLYFLGFSDTHKKIIEKIASQGLKIVNIPICYETASDARLIQKHASIGEFLSLMKGAKYVLTDSFHGAAFAVNYKKNFYSVSRSDTKFSLNSRTADFLRKITLENRIIDKSNVSDVSFDEIDYSKVQELLEAWKKDSLEYLYSALGKATEEQDA